MLEDIEFQKIESSYINTLGDLCAYNLLNGNLLKGYEITRTGTELIADIFPALQQQAGSIWHEAQSSERRMDQDFFLWRLAESIAERVPPRARRNKRQPNLKPWNLSNCLLAAIYLLDREIKDGYVRRTGSNNEFTLQFPARC